MFIIRPLQSTVFSTPPPCVLCLEVTKRSHLREYVLQNIHSISWLWCHWFYRREKLAYSHDPISLRSLSSLEEEKAFFLRAVIPRTSRRTATYVICVNLKVEIQSFIDQIPSHQYKDILKLFLLKTGLIQTKTSVCIRLICVLVLPLYNSSLTEFIQERNKEDLILPHLFCSGSMSPKAH